MKVRTHLRSGEGVALDPQLLAAGMQMAGAYASQVDPSQVNQLLQTAGLPLDASQLGQLAQAAGSQVDFAQLFGAQ